MNSILFFLTPKAMCAFLYDDYTIRQAMEKMEVAGYPAIPILSRQGEYRGTLKEGDLLWAWKNMCNMDMRQAECRRIMEIPRRKDNIPVRITASMSDLIERASNQNFVPVIDDYGAFIGLITRKAIIKYCKDRLFSQEENTYKNPAEKRDFFMVQVSAVLPDTVPREVFPAAFSVRKLPGLPCRSAAIWSELPPPGTIPHYRTCRHIQRFWHDPPGHSS